MLNRFIATVILFCFFVGALTVETVQSREALQGNVQFDERLDPLPKGLQDGTRFDFDMLKEVEHYSESKWYRIPKWYAGDWISRNSRTIRVSVPGYSAPVTGGDSWRNYLTDGYHGLQQDRKGDIWDLIGKKGWGKGIGDDIIGLAKFEEIRPIMLSADRIVMFDRFAHWSVERESGIIHHAVQVERLSTTVRISDNLFMKRYVSREFDGGGKFAGEIESIVIDQRKGPFVPINTLSGQDLKESFCEFLATNGFNDLLPDDVSFKLSSQPLKKAPSQSERIPPKTKHAQKETSHVSVWGNAPNSKTCMKPTAETARVAYLSGDLLKAEQLYRFSVAEAGEDLERLSTAFLNLGTVLQEEKNWEEAENVYRKALWIRLYLYGGDAEATWTCRHRLGFVLGRMHKEYDDE